MPSLPATALAPQRVTKTDKGELALSLYDDAPCTPDDVAVAIRTLSICFNMQAQFWAILTERIIANAFTKRRLQSAVDYVLDNFKYKDLSVANIITFDKSVKLLTPLEIAAIRRQHGDAAAEDYERVRIGDRVFYVSKREVELQKHNLL
ncbi:MAG: hypothetical protein MdMp024_0046 [Bacteroidales bacterium]